jgi:hypothetical protein
MLVSLTSFELQMNCLHKFYTLLRSDGIDIDVSICKCGLLFLPHPMDAQVVDVEEVVSIPTFFLLYFFLVHVFLLSN